MAREVKSPAYQWYPRDFAADEPVVLMTLEEEGAYRRLLDHQWLHGSIPADLRQLAAICKGVSVARMRRIWKALAPCFVPLPGDATRLINPRLERVRAEQAANRERRSQAGRIGNATRWGSHADDEPDPSPDDRNDLAEGSQCDPDGIAESSRKHRSASATASATARDTALPTASTRALEGFLARVDDGPAADPDLYRSAVRGAVRAARNPVALIAELGAIESGIHPPAYSAGTIGRALHELAVAGGAVSSAKLRAFCRNVGRGPGTTPMASGGLYDDA